MNYIITKTSFIYISFAKLNGSLVFISKCSKFWDTLYKILSNYFIKLCINKPVIFTHNLTNAIPSSNYIGFKFQYEIQKLF